MNQNNEVTVYIKNGEIHIIFSHGILEVDAANLGAQIKRLPDVATVSKRDDRVIVRLACVANIGTLPTTIGALARDFMSRRREIPQPAAAQVSLF